MATEAEYKTVEELSQQLQLDIRHLPVEHIEPDPANPNVVDEGLMEALSREIDNGFSQPIVVRPVGDDRWRIIDGEHRWRLIRQKGYATIPAVVEDVGDEDEARIRLLTFNRLRGQFVPIRLAYVLADLAKRVPEDQLRQRLGMEAGEMRDNLRLASFSDDMGDKLRESVEQENKQAPTVLTFVCSRAQDAQAIERAVDRLADEQTDRGQALARICRAWEKEHKKAAKGG